LNLSAVEGCPSHAVSPPAFACLAENFKSMMIEYMAYRRKIQVKCVLFTASLEKSLDLRR